MYKVITHDNSREYYEQLYIENDAVYITANSSLSYMIRERANVKIEDKWKVLDIDNFIKKIYPNWTDTVNEIKLKGEIRKAIYKVRENTYCEIEMKELKFLEDNISILYSDFRCLSEAGIKELKYETEDVKLKLIKSIFNIFTKSSLYNDINKELINLNNIKNFPENLISSHLLSLGRVDKSNAKAVNALIRKKNDSIKKVYFYNISNLDLRRFLLAQVLTYSGFEVIFVIPYFKSLKVVNKCWNQVYGNDSFNIIKSEKYTGLIKKDIKYINYLEGRKTINPIEEKIISKNYREVYDFKKKIKDKIVITLYKDSLKSILERDTSNVKNHCYQTSIGRFLFNLYNCNIINDEIRVDFSTYRELITSGWIEYRGWNGIKLHSYLIDNDEYFSGVTTLDEIINRIEKLKELKEVSDIFYNQSKERIKKNPTKQFLSNPFKSFGYTDLEKYKVTVNNMLEVTIKLKRFLLKAFGSNNELINIEEHFNLLIPLYKNKYIADVYNNGTEIQKKVTRKIFAILNNPKEFGDIIHREELKDLLNAKLYLDIEQVELDEQEDDFSVDQLEGLIYREKILKRNKGTLYLGDMSYKAYQKYIEKFKEFDKILSTADLKFIFENTLKSKSKDIVLQGIKLQESSRKAGESYFKFALANLFINYKGNIEFSWIEGLRKDDSKAIFFKQIESLYGKSDDEKQYLENNEFIKEDEIEISDIYKYDSTKIINNVNSVPEVALRDLDFCGDKFLYSSIIEGHPTYYSDFHHKLAFSAIVGMLKNNIEDGYLSMLKFVLPLFPQWKDVVKKNILDCEFSRNGLREYRYFEGINYPKSIDALYILKSKYIVTENNKIRNRYNKGEFDGSRYYKEFVNEFIIGDQNNHGLHCVMCPHSYLCKKGEFVIDRK